MHPNGPDPLIAAYEAAIKDYEADPEMMKFALCFGIGYLLGSGKTSAAGALTVLVNRAHPGLIKLDASDE